MFHGRQTRIHNIKAIYHLYINVSQWKGLNPSFHSARPVQYPPCIMLFQSEFPFGGNCYYLCFVSSFPENKLLTAGGFYITLRELIPGFKMIIYAAADDTANTGFLMKIFLDFHGCHKN